jgi:hypothetical protein
MSAIEDKLYALLTPMLAGELLVFADQNAPRPALPYWTLNVSPRRHLGRDGYSQGVDDDGDQDVFGAREATAQVQRIGNDSDTYVQDLRDNLSKISVQEQWQVSGVSLFNTGDVLDVPFPMDNNHLEPRAVMDLFVRFGTKVIDRVGIIETVVADATYP